MLSLVFVTAWFGPVYKLVDGCQCGRSRVWFALAAGPQWVSHWRFFLGVKREDDIDHQHVFWDGQIAGTYPTDWIK